MVAEAYRAAVRAGIGGFWELTPWELRIELEAFGERLRYEQESDTVLAYTFALLSRTERLPKLDKLLKGKKAKRNLAEELKAAFKALPEKSEDGG